MTQEGEEPERSHVDGSTDLRKSRRLVEWWGVVVSKGFGGGTTTCVSGFESVENGFQDR